MQPTSSTKQIIYPENFSSVQPSVVVNFDEKCDKTIAYLKAADQLLDIIAYREQIYASLLPKHCKSVLDFGCGLGTFLKGLNERFPAGHYVGIDHNSQVIEYAKGIHNGTSIQFLHVDNSEFLKNTKEKYTTIIVERVLHCLDDEKILQVLESLINMLDAEGQIIIITPDFPSQKIFPLSETTTKVVNYYYKHSAVNPVSASKILAFLKVVGERIHKLKINQEICHIVTQGLQKTEEDLCLNDIVKAAVKDNWINEEAANKWLHHLSDHPEKVFGVSDMYIFTLS